MEKENERSNEEKEEQRENVVRIEIRRGKECRKGKTWTDSELRKMKHL